MCQLTFLYSLALVLRCFHERIIAVRTEAPRGQCLLMTPSLHLPCTRFVTDSLSFCMKGKHLEGAGEMTQMLKALTDVDDQDLIPASMWYFMTVFNYNSMKCHSFIYGLWVLYTRYTYISPFYVIDSSHDYSAWLLFSCWLDRGLSYLERELRNASTAKMPPPHWPLDNL